MLAGNAAVGESSVAVGDTVTFGSYRQGTSEEKTPIEWLVLDAEGDQVLLISKYVLDAHRYHSDKEDVLWADCELRGWLNDEFYAAAFTQSEQSQIQETPITTGGNSRRDIPECETQDKIFLLSLEESETYFDSDESRVAEPTEYALTLNVIVNKTTHPNWWLRSPGKSDFSAAMVKDTGKVYDMGQRATTKNIGIRPAVWVNLSEKAESTLGNVSVGEYVEFGRYPVTHAGTDETPIKWLVLEVNGDQALLISKYALDAKPYNEEYEYITWENCTLRSWLNDEFYDAAFNEEEKDCIIQTEVKAEDNPRYGTDAGNDTEDNVFLLSISEAEQYFDDDESRICNPTNYAVNQGAYTSNGACWWWLRSPGYYSSNASYVRGDGSVDDDGYNVYDTGISVRPAVWVRLF